MTDMFYYPISTVLHIEPLLRQDFDEATGWAHLDTRNIDRIEQNLANKIQLCVLTQGYAYDLAEYMAGLVGDTKNWQARFLKIQHSTELPMRTDKQAGTVIQIELGTVYPTVFAGGDVPITQAFMYDGTQPYLMPPAPNLRRIFRVVFDRLDFAEAVANYEKNSDILEHFEA